jgi:hypothetical protein
MLHLHECANHAPTEPLHSVGDSAAVEESAVEPLHLNSNKFHLNSYKQSHISLRFLKFTKIH